MINIEHPYTRYGLAVALFKNRMHDIPSSEKELCQLVATSLSDALNKVKVHTKDKVSSEGESILRYEFVPREALGEGKQDSKNFYFLSPHVITSDKSTGDLIKSIAILMDNLERGLGNFNTKLQRSFSPFTSKLNQGKSSLSEPVTDLISASLTALATITPSKPAMQIEFKNQGMIPDISLEGMILFIDLFERMVFNQTEGLKIATVKPKSKYFRPKMHRGNFPNAPYSPLFGPISLLAAMASWAKEADALHDFEKVLAEIVKNSIYLVSYEGNLMSQQKIGSHVYRLALRYNLTNIIQGLSQVSLYNEDDNKPDNPKRQLFFMMAGRFLQLYSPAAFQDFLAFRGQYHNNFTPILEDYFMNEHSITPELVQSARAFGAFLNRVAYHAAKAETDERKTKRTLHEAKSRFLAELESVVMNAKQTSEIFALVNIRAGRMSEMDGPNAAYPFMEAALTGLIDKKTTQNMVLAFMRLRSSTESQDVKGQDESLSEDASESSFEDPEE